MKSDDRVEEDVEEIDPLLRDLIAELNTAGYETFCSCQGKTSDMDFKEERHCDGAFVTISVAVLRKVSFKARRVGLHVCFRNRFVTSLGGDEKDDAEIIARNLDFPAKMRKLFGLAGYPCQIERASRNYPAGPLWLLPWIRSSSSTEGLP